MNPAFSPLAALQPRAGLGLVLDLRELLGLAMQRDSCEMWLSMYLSISIWIHLYIYIYNYIYIYTLYIVIYL